MRMLLVLLLPSVLPAQIMLDAVVNSPAPSASVIRGSGTQVGSGPYVISWPVGTQAGDLAVIHVLNDFMPTLPTGWSSLYSNGTSCTAGFVASRVLDSTDISTGSVTVAGAIVGFDGGASIVTFVGAIPQSARRDGDGAAVAAVLRTP